MSTPYCLILQKMFLIKPSKFVCEHSAPKNTCTSMVVNWWEKNKQAKRRNK